ncbi:glycosyl transferase group 1 [Desulfosarcina ovata subsp. sediminis]|uniref:Glycosyl transferase group 1 n=1 Tax=Desulfosarcina ovata subsp. sediminis TaxID=885957 RepID=A0A5K7ZHC9_9BACT|nr:glycosyltransferase [Desulfosarcina ovata]BBO80261.1 glycosyl transferase group 1 [Desulfosarcina ovata subsp. sediminis]
MKIAVISGGNQSDRKGLFNNVNERIKRLQVVNGFTIDSYIIQFHRNKLLQKLKGECNNKKDNFFYADGVNYRSILLKLTFMDSLFISKLRIRSYYQRKKLLKQVGLFRGYDILLTHTFESNFIGSMVKKKYKIPFVITWHGSDIHTNPFKNINIKKETKKLIENADYNFFVSRKLLEISDEISANNNKDVLYSGPSNRFYKYCLDKKTKFKIQTKYAIGFIGNFVPIKNVLVLPHIFLKVSKSISDITYIIVGDGELNIALQNKFEKSKLENVFFLGKQNPESIPDIMNCLDVLVLPSFNEGLPRVALEALACGVNVVGSKVGGIPEAIGEKNTYDLNDSFVDNISKRMIEILNSNEKPNPLPDKFFWDKTIEKEITVYKDILSKNKSYI